MRKAIKILILVLILAIVVYQINLSPSSAYAGGDLETNTSLNLSGTQVIEGTSVTASSSTTFFGGPAFGPGIHSYYSLNPSTQIGVIDRPLTKQVSNPVISFNVDLAMTIWVVRIPIIDITGSITSGITWKIHDELANPALIDGYIDFTTINAMVADGILYLAINSFQTLPDVWSSGLSLSAGTYFLTLSIPGSPQFSFATTSTITADSELFDGGTSTSGSPLLFVHEGSFLGEQTIDGTASSSVVFSPTRGIYDIFVYFGDNGKNFAGSYNTVKLDVLTATNPTVSVGDTTVSRRSVAALSANVNDGNPVIGATVNFYIDNPNSYRYIGSATTTTGGVATLFYTANEVIGTYSIKAEAIVGTNQGYGVGMLTVQTPIAAWSSSQADGTFNSLGNNNTAITISTNVVDINSNPIAGVSVQLLETGVLLQTQTTDTNGYVEFSLTSNLAAGLYSGKYTLHLNDSNWNIADLAVDLIINKAVLIINANDQSAAFDNQPIFITGTVSDSFGTLLTHDITLQQQNGGSWETLELQSNVNQFNFTLPILNAGQHVFRLIVPDSTSFFSNSKLVNVQIGQAVASLTRETLSSLETIDYHGSGDLSVRALQLDGTPISNAIIKTTYYDLSSNRFIFISNTTTDVNGWALISWTPDESLFTFMYLPLEIMFTLYDHNYQSTSLGIQYQLEQTTLAISISVNPQAIYLSNSVVEINTVDGNGFDGEAGTSITVTIESIQYNVILDIFGKATITHRFTLIGDQLILAAYSNPTGVYLDASQTLQITVNKAAFSIIGSPLTVNQGDYANFSISVKNQIGNPVEGIIIDVVLQGQITRQLGTISLNNGYGNLIWLVDEILGTHNIIFQFAGNAQYNATQQSYPVDVSKYSSEIQINTNSTWIYGSPQGDRTVTLDLHIPNLLTPLFNQPMLVEIGSDQWNVLTDSTGTAQFIVPQFYNPGTYLMQISFVGNVTTLDTNASQFFTILGSDIFLQWIDTPEDTYFGDDLMFSFQIVDSFGSPLSNLAANIKIGFNSYNYITDIQGIINITQKISHPFDLVDIIVDLQGQGGWNPLNQTLQILNVKRDFQTSIVDQSLQFGSTLSVDVTIVDNEGISWNDIQVDVYLFDQSSGTFVFLSNLLTNINGSFIFSSSLPLLNVGQQHTLQWRIYHTQFNNHTVSQKITIIAQDLTVDFEFNNGTINGNNPIVVKLLDPNSLALNNVTIDLMYIDVVILWQQQLLSNIGQATFDFIPPTGGNLIIFYAINDPLGNYGSLQGNFTIFIDKDNLDLQMQLDDENGDLQAIVTAFSSTAQNYVSNVNLELYGYDLSANSWELLQIGQLQNLNLSFSLDAINYNQFRIILREDDRYFASQIDFIVNLVSPTLIMSGKSMEYNQSLLIDTILAGNGTRDGYRLDVYITYISQPFQEGTFLGMIYSIDGRFNSSLPIPTIPGTYELHLILPQQGYFQSGELIVSLTINKISMNINPIDLEVNRQLTDTIVFSYDNQEIDLQGVNFELYILDNTRQLLATGVVDQTSQQIIFTFFIYWDVNQYTIELSIIGNQFIVSNDQQFVMIVTQKTILQLQIPQTITIDYGGIVFAYLYDDFTLQPVTNAEINLFLIVDGNRQLIGTSTTNTTGYAEFLIPTNLAQSLEVEFLAEYAIQEFFGSSSDSVLYSLIPGMILINTELIDYGVTNNMTINLDLQSIGLENIGGQLTWSLTTLAGTTVLDGSFSMVNNANFIISNRLVGNYLLFIDFQPEVSVYQADRLQITLEIVKAQELRIETIDTQGMYLNPNDVIEVVVEQSGNSSTPYAKLNDIPISITILRNNQVIDSWSTIIGRNGQIQFLFDDQYLPGIYAVSIVISDNEFVEDQVLSFQFIIVDADYGFNVDVSSDIFTGEDLFYMINDQYFTGSVYNLTIFSNDQNHAFVLNKLIRLDGRTIDRILDGEELTLDFLFPGSYVIQITRIRDNFVNRIQSYQFSILPIPLEIAFNTSADGNNMTITLDYTLLVDSDIIDRSSIVPSFDIYLEIQGENLTFSMNSTSFILELYGQGSIYLKVDAFGYFTGTFDNFINYSLPDLQFDASTTINQISSSLDNSTSGLQDQLNLFTDGLIKPQNLVFIGILSIVGVAWIRKRISS